MDWLPEAAEPAAAEAATEGLRYKEEDDEGEEGDDGEDEEGELGVVEAARDDLRVLLGVDASEVAVGETRACGGPRPAPGRAEWWWWW